MGDDENCIFCKIIKGNIPAAKVYEDEQVLAFLDISPVNRGHTLVVPKRHSRNMLEDSDGDISACMKVVKKVAGAVMKATYAEGFNLGVNTNRAAGQVVFHTHFHVIPRLSSDGLRHWPQSKYNEGEMEKVRSEIIRELEE